MSARPTSPCAWIPLLAAALALAAAPAGKASGPTREPRAAVLRVTLTADPDVLLVDRVETPLAQALDRIGKQAPKTLEVALGRGGALAADRLLSLLLDLLDAAGGEAAIVLRTPKARRGPTPGVDPALDAAELAAPISRATPALVAGEEWFEEDLRGLARIEPEGPVFDATDWTRGRAPGWAGPRASIAFAAAPGTRTYDVFAFLAKARAAGCSRAYWLLAGPTPTDPRPRSDGEVEGGDPGGTPFPPAVKGLPLRIERTRDEDGRLFLARPPKRDESPVWRAGRALLARGLATLSHALDRRGVLPGDDVFSDREATALGAIALAAAGVRAGDGTREGRALLEIERALCGFPFERGLRRRRERAILAAALGFLAAETRHPFLRPAARRGLETVARELESDEEWKDGVSLGFEAVAVRCAEAVGLPGSKRAAALLRALADAAVDEEGRFLVTSADRSSVDAVALAAAMVALGFDPATGRVRALASEGRAKPPPPDRPITNPRRALLAFFRAELAETAAGEDLDALIEDLRALLSSGREVPGEPWPGSAARRALVLRALAVPPRVAARAER